MATCIANNGPTILPSSRVTLASPPTLRAHKKIFALAPPFSVALLYTLSWTRSNNLGTAAIKVGRISWIF